MLSESLFNLPMALRRRPKATCAQRIVRPSQTDVVARTKKLIWRYLARRKRLQQLEKVSGDIVVQVALDCLDLIR